MMNVHVSRLDKELTDGCVIVKPGNHPDRIWIADPEMTCLHPMRDGMCEGDKDHRGRHSTVWFWCDDCGKSRRGEPYRKYYDVNGDLDLTFCFMCYRVTGPA